MKSFDPGRFNDAARLIRMGALREAVRLHYSIFPAHGNPLIHELDEEDLWECLSTPLPVFSFCSDDELRELRQRMALGLVSGVWPFHPGNEIDWTHPMTPRAVEQNFWAAIAGYRNLMSWRKSGVVLRAKLVGSGDGPCEHCRMAAEHDYDIMDVPRIPLLSCRNLNSIGCRCALVASKIRGIDG
jgi:hypothetical protein